MKRCHCPQKKMCPYWRILFSGKSVRNLFSSDRFMSFKNGRVPKGRAVKPSNRVVIALSKMSLQEKKIRRTDLEEFHRVPPEDILRIPYAKFMKLKALQRKGAGIQRADTSSLAPERQEEVGAVLEQDPLHAEGNAPWLQLARLEISDEANQSVSPVRESFVASTVSQGTFGFSAEPLNDEDNQPCVPETAFSKDAEDSDVIESGPSSEIPSAGTTQNELPLSQGDQILIPASDQSTQAKKTTQLSAESITSVEETPETIQFSSSSGGTEHGKLEDLVQGVIEVLHISDSDLKSSETPESVSLSGPLRAGESEARDTDAGSTREESLYLGIEDSCEIETPRTATATQPESQEIITESTRYPVLIPPEGSPSRREFQGTPFETNIGQQVGSSSSEDPESEEEPGILSPGEMRNIQGSPIATCIDAFELLVCSTQKAPFQPVEPIPEERRDDPGSKEVHESLETSDSDIPDYETLLADPTQRGTSSSDQSSSIPFTQSAPRDISSIQQAVSGITYEAKDQAGDIESSCMVDIAEDLDRQRIEMSSTSSARPLVTPLKTLQETGGPNSDDVPPPTMPKDNLEIASPRSVSDRGSIMNASPQHLCSQKSGISSMSDQRSTDSIFARIQSSPGMMSSGSRHSAKNSWTLGSPSSDNVPALRTLKSPNEDRLSDSDVLCSFLQSPNRSSDGNTSVTGRPSDPFSANSANDQAVNDQWLLGSSASDRAADMASPKEEFNFFSPRSGSPSSTISASGKKDVCESPKDCSYALKSPTNSEASSGFFWDENKSSQEKTSMTGRFSPAFSPGAFEMKSQTPSDNAGHSWLADAMQSPNSPTGRFENLFDDCRNSGLEDNFPKSPSPSTNVSFKRKQVQDGGCPAGSKKPNPPRSKEDKDAKELESVDRVLSQESPDELWSEFYKYAREKAISKSQERSEANAKLKPRKPTKSKKPSKLF